MAAEVVGFSWLTGAHEDRTWRASRDCQSSFKGDGNRTKVEGTGVKTMLTPIVPAGLSITPGLSQAMLIKGGSLLVVSGLVSTNAQAPLSAATSRVSSPRYSRTWTRHSGRLAPTSILSHALPIILWTTKRASRDCPLGSRSVRQFGEAPREYAHRRRGAGSSKFPHRNGRHRRRALAGEQALSRADCVPLMVEVTLPTNVGFSPTRGNQPVLPISP